MKTKLSCALGLALLAASFTFGTSFACSEATETTSPSLQTVAPEANVTETPSYGSGAQTGVAEVQPAEVDQPSSIVREKPSSTDAPLIGDAIVVEITLTRDRRCSGSNRRGQCGTDAHRINTRAVRDSRRTSYGPRE
jgi:hypothetical protein